MAAKRIKIYVLDTSAILYEPDLIYMLGDGEIVIPLSVIKELDGHKKSANERNAQAARYVSRELDRLSSWGDIEVGVPLSTGGTLRISSTYLPFDGLESDADNKIVGTALQLRQEGCSYVMLLTTDTNMRIVARGNGLKAEFYPFGFDYEEAEHRKVSFISTSDEVESVPVSRKSSDIERSYGADRQDFLKLIADTIKRRSSFKRSLKFGGDDKFEDPLKFHTTCAIWRRRDEDI